MRQEGHIPWGSEKLSEEDKKMVSNGPQSSSYWS